MHFDESTPARSPGRLDELSRDECLGLLRRGVYGRVAYTDHALPAITPVNYAMAGESIVFRTAPGTALAEGTRDAVVAFEVDEIDASAQEGWSVVVVGVASELSRPVDVHRAIELTLVPWPTGIRNRFVRITPTYITGRRLTDGRLLTG